MAIQAISNRLEPLEDARATSNAIKSGLLTAIKTFGPIVVALVALALNKLGQGAPT